MNSPTSAVQRKLEELKNIAWNHKNWVDCNPGGPLLDLQKHLEGVLAELRECIKHDAKPTGELKVFADAIAESLMSDDPGHEADALESVDLETVEHDLLRNIESVKRLIARYGNDVRIPISAIPR